MHNIHQPFHSPNPRHTIQQLSTPRRHDVGNLAQHAHVRLWLPLLQYRIPASQTTLHAVILLNRPALHQHAPIRLYPLIKPIIH